MDCFLHLSIHEIHSDSRVGPALWSFNSSIGRVLWSFNGGVDGDSWNTFDLELIKSTENPLAITFWGRFGGDWKLLDISTTETDASDKFPLIESRRIGLDLKIKEVKLVGENICPGLSEIFMQC